MADHKYIEYIKSNEETIFGTQVITTINFDEQNIIRDILKLHGNGNYIECDPCYSVGNFYKKGLPKPKFIYDKYPQTKDTIEAESHKLPLDDNSINIIMFDPPFVLTGDTYVKSKDTSCIIASRFKGFNNFEELKSMYGDSLKEFYRILKDDGIVIFKCQDVVSSAKQYFSHVWIMNKAVEIGYYPKDLFILIVKNRINDGRKQQHARKYHSYYWVLKKCTNKVNYNTRWTQL